MFTNGCELTTAITNIFIMLSALYSFLKVKNIKVNTYWKKFFLCLAFDGLMGFIIHGFNFNKLTIDILWCILLIGFSFTINYLLFIFLGKFIKLNNKHFILLTSILYLVLFLEIIFKIEFLYTFIVYTGIALLIIIYIIIKEYIKNRKYIYYLFAIISQVIGGIFLLNQSLEIYFIFDFDQNGIYHIFMVFTCLFFYIGCKNENIVVRTR